MAAYHQGHEVRDPGEGHQGLRGRDDAIGGGPGRGSGVQPGARSGRRDAGWGRAEPHLRGLPDQVLRRGQDRHRWPLRRREPGRRVLAHRGRLAGRGHAVGHEDPEHGSGGRVRRDRGAPVFELDEFEPGPAIEGFRELEEMESIAKDVERTRPDLSGAVAPNGTVTVLFTDIEGSTQLTEDLGDREWMEVLRKHNEIVREQLALHSGFEVKSQGDGFMLAFSSARDALRCARGFQRAVAESDSNGHRLRVRMGLHTGEPIREADDFYGKAVIQAARIAAEARGSEILVSSLVRDLTESSGEYVFATPRDVELKGLSGTHRVAPVLWQDD